MEALDDSRRQNILGNTPLDSMVHTVEERARMEWRLQNRPQHTGLGVALEAAETAVGSMTALCTWETALQWNSFAGLHSGKNFPSRHNYPR